MRKKMPYRFLSLFKAKKASYLLSGLTILLLSSCACNDPRKPEVDKNKRSNSNEVAQLDTAPMVKSANKLDQPITAGIAVINSLDNNKIQGKVLFIKVDEGVKVIADIEGLTPGEHGFHIHEFGDCSSKTENSMGAHFNPTNSKHGGPESAEKHVGDLGNLSADENGRAHYEAVNKVIKLQGRNSILGRSIIIHADKDDFVTQPAGASGDKIACGIIEPFYNQ